MAPRQAPTWSRLITITTALAVAAVAAVAAVISNRHAYELVTAHGETGLTARLLPFTIDGLILAASMQAYVLRVPRNFRLILASGGRSACADAASVLLAGKHPEVRSAGRAPRGPSGMRGRGWPPNTRHCLVT